MLASGDLNRRVRFERKSVTRDGSYGSEVVTWTTVAEVWAAVAESADTGPSGGERVAQDVKFYTGHTELQIRYRSDLAADMRVVLLDRSKTLQLVSLAEMGRREGLRIVCEDYSV